MNVSSLKKIGLLSVALCSAASTAQALEIYPTAGIGLDTGGDTILDVYYTDGSSDSLSLGNGFSLFIGGEAALNEEKTIFGNVTLGWKSSAVDRAIDASVAINRYPLEAMLFYRAGKHRFGVGATHHLEISLDTTGKAAGINAKIESGIGTILEYGMTMDADSTMFIGVRYTDLTYHFSEYNVDLDASSTGIYLKSGF